MSMLLALAAAAALSNAGPSASEAISLGSQQAAVSQGAQADDPVRLEDVEVTGRPLNSLILNFIDQVAAPARNRGLARWEGTVCVGAANLRNDVAQYLVDRVSTVAEDLGLEVGRPGCGANVLIVAAADADALTQSLTDQRRRAFRMGGSGMDRGASAFEAFRESDAPVRWWSVSAPVDADTGAIATRIPGHCSNACTSVTDMVPVVSVRGSRLTTEIVDRILRTVVVLDVDQLSNVSAQQLADYIAMVVLAQVDPEADTSAYASVLNVFQAPETADGLTQWDIAYLDGLYDAQRTLRSTRAANHEIASSIERAHQRLNAAEE